MYYLLMGWKLEHEVAATGDGDGVAFANVSRGEGESGGDDGDDDTTRMMLAMRGNPGGKGTKDKSNISVSDATNLDTMQTNAQITTNQDSLVARRRRELQRVG